MLNYAQSLDKTNAIDNSDGSGIKTDRLGLLSKVVFNILNQVFRFNF
jgi:hypothetical protein